MGKEIEKSSKGRKSTADERCWKRKGEASCRALLLHPPWGAGGKFFYIGGKGQLAPRIIGVHGGFVPLAFGRKFTQEARKGEGPSFDGGDLSEG